AWSPALVAFAAWFAEDRLATALLVEERLAVMRLARFAGRPFCRFGARLALAYGARARRHPHIGLPRARRLERPACTIATRFFAVLGLETRLVAMVRLERAFRLRLQPIAHVFAVALFVAPAITLDQA